MQRHAVGAFFRQGLCLLREDSLVLAELHLKRNFGAFGLNNSTLRLLGLALEMVELGSGELKRSEVGG